MLQGAIERASIDCNYDRIPRIQHDDIPSPDLFSPEMRTFYCEHRKSKEWTRNAGQRRVLATVKNTALNAVFPISLRLQFPNLGRPKKSYIIYIQFNLFSHLIIGQYSNCIIHRSESGNTIFSIFAWTRLV